MIAINQPFGELIFEFFTDRFWPIALDLEQIKANTNFKIFLPN